VEGDERELVRRCLARDELAYRELVRTYQGSVTNLAWRITGSADDAAEVAQETFIRVLRSLHTYDPERPFPSWLFKIASNLALDLIRRRKRRPIGLEDLSGEAYADLSEELRRAIVVLRAVYRPQGFNAGMNLGEVAGAGIKEHLHWHVVPRWGGDTNFMPVLADAKVIVEHLEEAWERIRKGFEA